METNIGVDKMTIKEISDKYKIPIKGIVHVGAHEGQEVSDYLELTKNIVLWEPIPSLAHKLDEKYPELGIVQAVAWHKNTTLDFWVTSFSEGSSALRPLEHEVFDQIEVEAKRLDSLENNCNVLVIDTQGSELNVLMGADLDKYDIIQVETNTRERYDGAASKEEILEYLQEKFSLVGDVAHSEDGVICDTQFIKRRTV
jgi:FkbM family methyltransferase